MKIRYKDSIDGGYPFDVITPDGRVEQWHEAEIVLQGAWEARSFLWCMKKAIQEMEWNGLMVESFGEEV